MAPRVKKDSAATTPPTAAAERPQRIKRAAPEPAEETKANTSKRRKVEAPEQTKKGAVAKKPANKRAAAKNPANISKKRKGGDADDEKPKKAAVSKAAPKKPVAKAVAPEKKAARKIAEPKSKKAAADKPARKVAQPKKATPVRDTAPTKGPVINEAPTEKMEVLVFGEGSGGELGLGTAKNAVDVKRPRPNANLTPDKVGVVQLAVGGMHVVALTADNTILTWGVNDSFALGRDTTWDGGLRDADAEDSDSDDEDSGLNPREATPTEIDLSSVSLPPDTKWTYVAAGDSSSFAITDDGKVYGWGTFRSNEGPFGFRPEVENAERPMLIPELKNIVRIACGANHAIALDNKGAITAWGSGQQGQLGRRVIERSIKQSLLPHRVGLPRGAKKIKSVASGEYHSFAIAESGDVYAWGLNSWGETGIDQGHAGEDAVVSNAQLVKALKGKDIVSIAGGAHHSVVATADGECLIWGKALDGTCGISKEDLIKLGDKVRANAQDKPALLTAPTQPPALTAKIAYVAAGPDHTIIVTKEGKAYSSGFSSNYQTGLGTDDDVQEFTLIDNTAAKDRVFNAAHPGGQFSMLTALAK